MQQIDNWFSNSKDYHEGVAIYASLPIKHPRLLQQLNQGKTNTNMATLVSELRKYNNTTLLRDTKQSVQPKKVNLKVDLLPKTTTQTTINIDAERKQQTNASITREFAGIKMGDLPPELRPKFLRAQSVFYQMIELKFALNDLLPEAQESALSIILQIEGLDEERDIIWAELHHWKAHKTLLVTTAPSDYSTKTPLQLDQQKRNLRSSITKISKRIDGWYLELANETKPHNQRLIENKINKSEKLLFKHEQHINTINKML